jgi:hypothetical protein
MNKRDLSISMRQAAVRSLALALPIALLQTCLYFGQVGFRGLPANASLAWFGFLLLAGIPMHEIIHLLAWSLFTGKSLRTFKLGFQWASLTPYAHSRQPMSIHAYRAGSIAPGLLLGIVPWIGSLFTGNLLLFFYGLAYTAAAGGDFLILWLLRNVKPDALVEDHPSNAGCYVLEP